MQRIRPFVVFLLLAMVLSVLPLSGTAAETEPATGPLEGHAGEPFFTIAWFPDTQNAVFFDPGSLACMFQYVADHADEENILAVVHTGDLVDNGLAEWEWERFLSSWEILRNKIPFLPIAGNHDLHVSRQVWDGYLAQPCVQEAVPEPQQILGGRGLWFRLEGSGLNLLIVGIGYGAEAECAEAANEVFAAYPDDYGILLVHEYLHPEYGIYENGNLLFSEVVQRNPNLRLILCGHHRGTHYRMDEIDDSGDGIPDRTVQTMLCNYQYYEQNGGQIRLLTFYPLSGLLHVRTLNTVNLHPCRDHYFKDSEFTLPLFPDL